MQGADSASQIGTHVHCVRLLLVDDPVRGLPWQQTNIVPGPPSCLRSQSLNRTKMLPLCLRLSLLASSSSQILRRYLSYSSFHASLYSRTTHSEAEPDRSEWSTLMRQICVFRGRDASGGPSDTSQSSGTSLLASVQTVAPSLRVEVNPINMRDAGEIERAVTAFARSPGGGLVVVASPAATRHRDLIIKLAARHKLPAIYYERFFVAGGGLISYGTDFVDQYRRAAGYVDRILKGEKPADLPVQAATKYQLVINLKTAKALGLTIPPSILARADEVIE